MKKTYIAPSIKVKAINTEDSMLAATSGPGFGGNADASTVVKSKSSGGFFSNDDEPTGGSGISWDDEE